MIKDAYAAVLATVGDDQALARLAQSWRGEAQHVREARMLQLGVVQAAALERVSAALDRLVELVEGIDPMALEPLIVSLPDLVASAVQDRPARPPTASNERPRGKGGRFARTTPAEAPADSTP